MSHASSSRDALVGWTSYADRPVRHRHGVLLDARGRGYTLPVAGHTHGIVNGRALPSTPDRHEHTVERTTSALAAIDRFTGMASNSKLADAEALAATSSSLRKGALAASMLASGLAFIASFSAYLATKKQEESR